MKRRWRFGCAVLFIMMLLAGCAQDKNAAEPEALPLQTAEASAGISAEAPESGGAESAEFPAQYIKETGAVQFHAKVIAGGHGRSEGLPEYKARSITVPHDPVYQAFFAGTELKNTQTLDRKNEDGSMGTAYYYHGTNGDSLSVLETSFRYYSSFAFQVLNAFSLEKGQVDYNGDLYQTNTEFSFLNHEEAVGQILEQMKAVGLELEEDACQYQYYSLDCETMDKEETILNMDGSQDTEQYKDTWSEADNCYYICIRQKLDGIPVAYAFAGAFSEYYDGNAPIQAIVSKDGIKMLAMDQLFQMTEAAAPAALLDFEQIARVVETKFGDLLTDAVYDVDRAELVYWSFKEQQGGYRMKPVWIFDVTEKSEDVPEGSWLQVIVDARTGEEIVL